MSWNPVKSVNKIGKSFKKLTSGKGLMTMAMYAGGAALMATGIGAPIGAMMMGGAAVGAAATGAFGHTAGDIATLGANAQVRYNQKMASAYNKAQQQQAKIAELNNERNLLQQIRAARIARSMNLSDYAGETNVFTSGAIGNLGSVGSQYLSNATYSVATGNLANAYQTYMNQYNWYQTQAKNSQIRWNNRMNIIKTGLSIYGMGDNLNTAQLGNFYARMRLNDAWADAGKAQVTAGETKLPQSWDGFMGYSWRV